MRRAGGWMPFLALARRLATALVASVPAGALAVICYAKLHGTKHRPALLARKPTKVAAIALANSRL
jgi:hypothetical protein